MELTDIQKIIVNAIGKVEFTATRRIAEVTGLHCTTIRVNAKALIEGGVIEKAPQAWKQAPYSIRLKTTGPVIEIPNFDEVLFGN